VKNVLSFHRIRGNWPIVKLIALNYAVCQTLVIAPTPPSWYFDMRIVGFRPYEAGSSEPNPPSASTSI